MKRDYTNLPNLNTFIALPAQAVLAEALKVRQNRIPEQISFIAARKMQNDETISRNLVEPYIENKKIQIYPKPAQNEFIINTDVLFEQVEVINTIGVIIGTYKFSGKKELIINSENMQSGLYYIRFMDIIQT
jgi:hypothetical protein